MYIMGTQVWLCHFSLFSAKNADYAAFLLELPLVERHQRKSNKELYVLSRKAVKASFRSSLERVGVLPTLFLESSFFQ